MTFITNSFRYKTAVAAYVSEESNETNLTQYTFSSQSIGTAANDRYVVVGIAGLANAGSRTITSVTIGGSSATQILQISDASGYGAFALFGLAVTTGTTADIVVDISSAPDRLGIGVFSITGIFSTTPTDTDTDNTASADLSKAIDVQAGGCIIGYSGNENSTATHTWTNLTEGMDTAVGSGGGSHTAAVTNSATAQSVTVTQAPSAGQSRQALLLAAFK